MVLTDCQGLFSFSAYGLKCGLNTHIQYAGCCIDTGDDIVTSLGMRSTSNGKDIHVGVTTTQSAALADKFLDESLLARAFKCLV